jgi:hypothetical protein
METNFFHWNIRSSFQAIFTARNINYAHLKRRRRKQTNPSGTVGWPVSKPAESLKCLLWPLAVQFARPCEAAEAYGTRKPFRVATSAAAE